MNPVTVTVTVAEGTFVFVGTRPDGSSNWRFLRPKKNGGVRPGPIPRRMKRILERVNQKQEDEE